MKTCVIFIALAMAGLVLSTETPPVFPSYHAEIGIPLAEKIFEAEQEMKQNGIIGDGVLNTRIVGGTNSSVGDHPYLGALIIYLVGGNLSMCGSSLLSETRSLTAGHCWNDGTDNGEKLVLVHGSETIFYNGVRTESKDVVVHEQFDRPTLRNDIAMIKHSNIILNDKIQPVGLPTGNLLTNKFTKLKATAIGYGRTSSDKSGDVTWDQMRSEVTVTVIANSQCGWYFAITSKNICTVGVRNGGVGICQGDSGGPLTVPINGTRILIGVTSFSMKICQDPPYYSGFTRVTEFMNWINDKLK